MLTNQKEQKAEDTFSIQPNAEENPNKANSSELLHREDIQNTPFQIVGNEDHGYFIAFGKYRVSEKWKSKNINDLQYDASLLLTKDLWNIVTNLMTIVFELSRARERESEEK